MPIFTKDDRERAQNCRSLAASAEVKLAKQLFFLAKEYDAAAHAREQGNSPINNQVDAPLDAGPNSQSKDVQLRHSVANAAKRPAGLHQVRAVSLTSYVAVARFLGL